MHWQAFFFDFDGVILDTTQIKTAAFAAMYEDHGPEIVARVVAYHREHGGISRMLKLRHFEETILGRELDGARLEELAADFSQRVLEQVLAAPPIPGAIETLESLAAGGSPVFVVSGTPRDELQRVIDGRGLGRLFTEVHGSPPLKPAILAEILERRGFDRARCLFLGDALTDQRAAEGAQMAFLGIEPPDDPHLFAPGTAVSRRVFVPHPRELSMMGRS
ncbi:MAG: haloacid dehalogenase [Proteobacteria bacterium]|nr:MAG: haloacid dehalogenase [Pseudomonadota bacterium]